MANDAVAGVLPVLEEALRREQVAEQRVFVGGEVEGVELGAEGVPQWLAAVVVSVMVIFLVMGGVADHLQGEGPACRFRSGAGSEQPDATSATVGFGAAR